MRKGKGWKRLLSVILAASVINSTLSSSIVMATENPQQDDSVVFYSGENGGADAGIDLQTEDQSGESEGMAGGKTEGQDGGSGKEESAGENESSGISGQGDVSSADPQESAGASGNTGAENNNESIPTEGNGDQRDNTEDLSSLYENGQVKIYNLSQLKKVGTGEQIHSGDVSEDTFGTGDALTDENGNALTYGNDTQYMLMNDIPMSGDDVWTLPEGFGGSFMSNDGGSSTKVYDSSTDTIYVYHSYQLAVLTGSADSSTEPVMTEDYDAAHFGMGQMIWPNGEENGNLTYSKDHNYAISKYFTAETPELIATQTVEGEQDGREYVGQVVFNETDAEGNVQQYILIGNKQQLEAIDRASSGEDPIKVTEPVWKQKFKSIHVGHYEEDGDPELIYPGDADIDENTLLFDDPKADSPTIGDEPGLTRKTVYRGSVKVKDEETTKYVYSRDAKKNINIDRIDGSDPAYTTTANYIIFRDIDLSGVDWEPLMFSGNILGTENMQGIDVDNGTVNKEMIEPVTISNITVRTSGQIDLKAGDSQGAGFFGVIGSRPGEGKNILLSAGTVTVTGLNLKTVDVENNRTQVKHDTGLLNGLLGIVTGILGFLFDWLLGGDLGDLSEMLLKGVDSDPAMFAAGSFAGSITGDVEITKCSVEDAKVVNTADRTGGFVGNIQGKTLYTLTEIGDLLEVIAGILKLIPFLGLGNLVDVLINGGILDLDQLIPAGYVAPTITECTLTNVNQETLGSATTNFIGGFAGRIEGGILKDISMTQDRNLTIIGDKFTGGFAGSIANTQVQGLLTNQDIHILEAIFSQSFVADVDISGNGAISVNAANSSAEETTENIEATYTGGFTGYIASSYVIDCGITNLERVTSPGAFVGGFAGYTSPGAAVTLGDEYTGETKAGIVDVVLETLKNVLTGKDDANTPLLSLVGVSPAYIFGCEVSGKTGVTIEGDDYVGGFVGRADAAQFGKSSQDQIQGWEPFTKNKVQYTGQGNPCKAENISLVKANKGYAGGFIGLAATANAAGVLDSTLVGAISLMPVKADSVTISGNTDGMTVKNIEGVAAGAIAQAVGSELSNINVENVKVIESPNDAAGFIGQAGVGGLADAGGLNVLGLNLVEVGSLLSVADMLQVKVNTATVSGIGDGFTVTATEAEKDNTDHRAAGFIAESASTQITNATVKNLKKVSTSDMTNGYAGGFVAVSYTGGLADIGNVEAADGGLLDIDGLLSAVPYLIPEYTDCKVIYKSDENSQQVEAACAGGFAGKLESGTIENSGEEYVAVEDLCNVHGEYYAGGFVGFATSGGLIASKGGISLLNNTLNVNIDQLLSVFNFYVPKIKNASISSTDGLTVTSDREIENAGQSVETQTEGSSEEDTNLYGLNAGCAGGYIGYGSGVQISNSNVNNLRYTTVKEPEDLQQQDGGNYFGDQSHYAVKASRYAGGYVGKLDIGNAAAVGNNLGLLGDHGILNLEQAVNALASVSSKIENSNVTGETGGFSVLANGKESENDVIGHAGGFAGSVDGSLIQNCNAHNFAYIIGQETAGGFVGNMEPGNVAELIGDVKVLGDLVAAESLVSAVQSFIPRIHSSSTDAVPCGGVVRAESASGDNGRGGLRLRGAAGGYAGHNNGGQIDGKEEGAKAERIRSVYGYEYAGGFTGYLHNADLIDTGSLSLLYGLIEVNNPLTAIQAVYATETNTVVTGPLRGMSYATFKNWYEAVGEKGPYGEQFKDLVGSEETYNDKISEYYYGYQVSAGRDSIGENAEYRAGIAGGYVGKMTGSVITNGQAYDLQKVEAMRSAGGFAGETSIGDLASVGGIALDELNITTGLPVLQTFVPVIKTSSVSGYKSGAQIIATGYSKQENDHVGNAGGYVGYLLGGTIEGTADSKCSVTNLRSVEGKAYVGGYAGQIQPGSLLTVDTSSEDGLLDKLLGLVIGTPDNLASLLNATISRVEYSEVSAYSDAGFVVDGAYEKEGILNKIIGSTGYAKAAGGYAGMIQGGIIGDGDIVGHDSNAGAAVNGVKTVTGGEYAGGFVGLADVSAVAEISTGETSILGSLLRLGAIDALDAFRTYIYDSNVSGSVTSGLVVNAKEGEEKENQNSGKYKVFSGNAGGFGGSVLNGTIKNSNVTGLKSVEAVNYSGGFLGHSGKSGAVDIDDLNILASTPGNLIGVSAGIADVCGSTVNSSTVTGMNGGYTVKSKGGGDEIAGGFIGYGDLARMEDDHAYELKQVASDGTAAGFIGKTSYAYLIEAGIDSALLEPIVKVVQALVTTLLQTKEWPEGGVVNIKIPGLGEISGLYQDGLLSVNVLGLVISVELGKKVNGQQQISVNIGDSSITIQCDAEGNIDSNEISDVIRVSLIKANRTRVAESSVTGISIGYDVFAAGAANDKDGSGEGYAGGFAGYNDEGLLEDNSMYQADTIKGAPGQIGEFSGTTSLKSNYTTLKDIEGDNNHYFVYRLWDEDGLTDLYAKDGTTKITDDAFLMEGWSEDSPYMIDQTGYYMYPVLHMQHSENYTHEGLWSGAYQTTEKNIVRFPVNVYVSDAQADLMLGTPTTDNVSDPDKSEGDMQDPCDDEAALTIQKIWYDDNDRDVKRPEKISITVTQKGDDSKWKKDIQMSSENVTTDPNVWTETVKVPVNKETGDGTYEKYDYEVNEASLAAEGYITIYGESADGYTLYIYNYRTEEFTQKDTVVIDYGLPVDVDVLTNDKMEQSELEADDYELAGVGVLNDTKGGNGYLLNSVTADMAEGFSKEESVAGSFGTAQVIIGSEETGSDSEMIGKQLIRYTPNTMQMKSYEKLLYAVKLNNHVKNEQNYVYGELDVIPATEIYYEDNFETVKAEDGTILAEGIEYINAPGTENQEKGPGIWETVNDGTTAATVQDTDRPGSDVVGRAWDDWYGNDTHYEDDFQYSNGTSHVVTVDADNKNEETSPKAEFTFTGTGFGVISVTSGDTGVVKVNIYKLDNEEPTWTYTADTIYKPDNEKPTWTYTADTYYGYRYNEDSGEWEVLPDATDENALYQTPILKVEDLPYSTYRVEIVPRYLNAFDHHYKEGSSSNDYKVYLDAIRVYNPAGTTAEHPKEGYDVIDSVYQQDGEQNPRFTEIRDILLNAENMHATLQEGTVFVDGNDELASIKDYENFGPKNEVYLKDGQGISFYLWSKYIPDKVQLSAKLADGSSTDLTFAVAVNEGTGEEQADWKYYKIDSYSIGTSHDMYYDFADQCIWEEAESGANEDAPFKIYRTKYPIVIANTRTAETPSEEAGSAEDILSITNLQWTGNPEAEAETAEVQTMAATERQELIATADMSNVRAAYYFLSEPAEENPGDVPGEGEDGKPEETPGTNPGEGEGGESEETPGTTPGEGEDSKPEETPGTTPGEGEDSKPEETPGTNPGEETGGDQSETPDAAPGGGAEDNSDSSKDGNSDTATSKKDAADRTENGVDNERKPAVVTGDQSAIGLTVIIMILALGAIAAVLVIRRKNHRKR